MFNQLLLEKVKQTESFQTGEYHQSILDVCYDEWQNGEYESYSEMIRGSAKKYGELTYFAIAAGKHNQQVCNGGHYQYWDNRYASLEGSFMSSPLPDDREIHDEMIRIGKKYGFHELSLFTEIVFNIYDNLETDFCDCDECEGMGEVEEEYDCEECNGEGCDECEGMGIVVEDETCGSCGGEGYDESEGCVVNGDELDTAFYKVNNRYMEILNIYFHRHLLMSDRKA